MAWSTSAGTRLANRSASRASAHCRRDHCSPSAEPLLERGQREVQQHDEGQLVGEEIVGDVGRRVVAGKRSRPAAAPGRGPGRSGGGIRSASRPCARRASPAGGSKRSNIASSVAWSPAKFSRTKASKAAASPSSARQNWPTCFSPRWTAACDPLAVFGRQLALEFGGRVRQPGRRRPGPPRRSGKRP